MSYFLALKSFAIWILSNMMSSICEPSISSFIAWWPWLTLESKLCGNYLTNAKFVHFTQSTMTQVTVDFAKIDPIFIISLIKLDTRFGTYWFNFTICQIIFSIFTQREVVVIITSIGLGPIFFDCVRFQIYTLVM